MFIQHWTAYGKGWIVKQDMFIFSTLKLIHKNVFCSFSFVFIEREFLYSSVWMKNIPMNFIKTIILMQKMAAQEKVKFILFSELSWNAFVSKMY